MATQPKTTRKRKKRRSGVILTVALVATVAIVAAAVLSNGGGEEGTLVETEKAEKRTIVETVTATGVVEPETQVVISSEVSGEIVYLGVEEGDRVSKGQVLIRINPESIYAQREQASAQILAAKSQVSSANATLTKAESEFKRLSTLYEKKLVTEQEVEAAETQLKVSRSQLESAEFQVEQAEANYKQVQESVKKTTITAPISGVVTRLNVKQGEKVVGAIQMTGTEIMTIADLSVIESVVDVVETDVVGIDVGDEAEIEVDALPNETFRAVVSRIANSPKQSGVGSQDQLTNFEVRLRFLDPDVRFRPGMTATALINTQSKANVISVPIQSVTTRDPKAKEKSSEDESEVQDLRLEHDGTKKKPQTIVFLVDSGKVTQRQVTTGLRDDRYIEITSGLAEGDVVVSGSYKVISKELEEGMVVRVDKKDDKESGKNSSGKSND
ncbi:MAG: efflux RND transporter periplasmic adaptor subunit [Candidatus Kapaibacterium sp.]